MESMWLCARRSADPPEGQRDSHIRECDNATVPHATLARRTTMHVPERDFQPHPRFWVRFFLSLETAGDYPRKPHLCAMARGVVFCMLHVCHAKARLVKPCPDYGCRQIALARGSNLVARNIRNGGQQCRKQ